MRTFVLLVSLWSPVILAHDIEFKRLSDNASNPLFYAVMVGLPLGAFAAFIMETPDSCSLRILGSDSSQIWMELLQHGQCDSSVSGEEEDGYSFINAKKYDAFVADNQESIKAILKKYHINHGRSALSSGPPRLESTKDDESCVGIESIRVCAGKSISIQKL